MTEIHNFSDVRITSYYKNKKFLLLIFKAIEKEMVISM